MEELIKKSAIDITKNEIQTLIKVSDILIYQIEKNMITIIYFENDYGNEAVLSIDPSLFLDLNWAFTCNSEGKLTIDGISNNTSSIKYRHYLDLETHFNKFKGYHIYSRKTQALMSFSEIIKFAKEETLRLNPEIKREVDF